MRVRWPYSGEDTLVAGIQTVRATASHHALRRDPLGRSGGECATEFTMADQARHRLIAVLAADAAGYSRLMADDDLATLAKLDAARETFRASVAATQGRIVDTAGDSVLAAFPSAQGAVAAALQVQATLQAAATPLAFRIGVHLGDVIEKPDGTIYGDGVNVAARLQALAAPGGVVISQAVLDVVGARLSVPTNDLGAQSVKNIPQPVHAHALGIGGAPPAAARPVNALPRPRTRFFGREREKAEAAELLADGGLLTLTGIGGSGKTRLALEVARERLSAGDGAVWFVDLAPVGDAADLARSVAAVLGLRDDQQRDVLEAIAARLQGQRALLVLDNCEHLVDAAAVLVETLLDACDNLAILATSREALGVPGEQVRPLRSLALAPPDDLDALRRCDAVRLFVDRGRLAVATFDVDARNAPAVHEICQRLDGIPLALELAAARLSLLSPEQIRARLDDRFRLLTGGRRALPRHQTLAAVIRWSYEQLPTAEQRLLSRLAVFSGGWTLAAATAVSAAPEDDVLEALSDLVSKSLVLVASDDAEARYTMLETVRQYAQDRLEESGEAESARAAHLTFFAGLAQAQGPGGAHPVPTRAFSRLSGDRDNIIAALRFGIDSRNIDSSLQLAGSLRGFWESSGQYELGSRLTEEVLTATIGAPPSRERLAALSVASRLALWTARYERRLALGEECLALARSLHAPLEEFRAFSDLATGALALQDIDRAWEAVTAMEQRAGPLGPREVRQAAHMKAEVLRSVGRLDEAEALYLANLQAARAEGESASAFNECVNLALVALARLDMAAGRAWIRAGVAERHGSDMGADGTAPLMEIVAALQAGSGDALAAARLLGAARAHEQRMGMRLEPVDEAPIARLLGKARDRLGAEEFDRAVAEGGLQAAERMLNLALAWLDAQ